MIDVCLLLEGTYPYVAGGVSTWVHQLISAMKDIRFGILYIAPHSDPTRRVKYNVPNHVIYMKEIYLHDYISASEIDVRKRKFNKSDIENLKKFYSEVVKFNFDNFHELIDMIRGDDFCLDFDTIFFSKEIWELLERFYKIAAPNNSFLDFFWTWRGTHLPLYQILKSEIPKAKIYHSVSTGYAGLIGAMAKVMNMGKFFLTEHGIYTHERMLEISQANWIYEREIRNYKAEKDMSFFKMWWIHMFRIMSRLAYKYSDQIFTLYEGNKLKQKIEGADADKIKIIPNGIDVDDFSEVEVKKRSGPNIALIGRVVPIKDIKTFIFASQIIAEKFPDANIYIIGPTDEEEEYFEECKNLVESLGLQERIVFTGRVDVKDYYKFLDVVVLTSISEAQPYVILEANVVGIPVVSTDVGSCREMLEGRSEDDRILGASGMITEVSNSRETASAIIKLLTDDEFYNACSSAGKKRVYKYYNQDDLLSRYLNVYEHNL